MFGPRFLVGAQTPDHRQPRWAQLCKVLLETNQCCSEPVLQTCVHLEKITSSCHNSATMWSIRCAILLHIRTLLMASPAQREIPLRNMQAAISAAADAHLKKRRGRRKQISAGWEWTAPCFGFLVCSVSFSCSLAGPR